MMSLQLTVTTAAYIGLDFKSPAIFLTTVSDLHENMWVCYDQCLIVQLVGLHLTSSWLTFTLTVGWALPGQLGWPSPDQLVDLHVASWLTFTWPAGWSLPCQLVYLYLASWLTFTWPAGWSLPGQLVDLRLVCWPFLAGQPLFKTWLWFMVTNVELNTFRSVWWPW